MPVLTRKAGVPHIELVEDTVQAALMGALTAWPADGQPDDPGAWLYRVAHNKLLGALRRQVDRARILQGARADFGREEDAPVVPYFSAEVKDDLLRMLFICCTEIRRR